MTAALDLKGIPPGSSIRRRRVSSLKLVRDDRARAKEILVMQAVIKNAHVRPPLLPIGGG